MKYIRTKNERIYEIIEETENSFELYSPFEKKMGCSCTMIKRILGNNEKPTYRLADTIEELCDEFVAVDNYGNKSIGNDFEVAKAKYKILNADAVKMLSGEIYGAIWTDKGLIYVAKMNKEGELELL